jgi:myo-inositol 2-dehydrogenase/D-chiro-inositol 1-dehydrogenase
MHRVLLIGAGRIGRIHAANVAANPALELAYVVDQSEEVAASVARAYGARVSDIDGALNDVAGVIVASSTDTHLDFSLRAAEKGKAIFCEKPLHLDVTKVAAAAPRFAELGAQLFLAFNRRFDPNFRRLKQCLDAGDVGVLETLHITSHDPAPPPPNYVATSGGLFKDMAIHDFDMARWLLDEEPVEVFAAGACLIDPEIGRLGDIDTARSILRTSSGQLCAIANSRRSGYGYDQRIEAFGSKGALCAGNVMESTVQSWTEAGAQTDTFKNFFLDRYAEAYRLEMAHFADILDGATPAIGFRDGWAALAIAEAATKSSQSGMPVGLVPP